MRHVSTLLVSVAVSTPLVGCSPPKEPGNTVATLTLDGGDLDEDGIEDLLDNCPDVANPKQENTDEDFDGDICDNCPDVTNLEQLDFDQDGIGNLCDPIVFATLAQENAELNKFYTKITVRAAVDAIKLENDGLLCTIDNLQLPIDAIKAHVLPGDVFGGTYTAETAIELLGLGRAENQQCSGTIKFAETVVDVDAEFNLNDLVLTGNKNGLASFDFSIEEHDSGLLKGFVEETQPIELAGTVRISKLSLNGDSQIDHNNPYDFSFKNSGTFPTGAIFVSLPGALRLERPVTSQELFSVTEKNVFQYDTGIPIIGKVWVHIIVEIHGFYGTIDAFE